MILDVQESKELCDWLMERGLGLGECAHFLGDMSCGDNFSLALLKVFRNREYDMEKIYDKEPSPNWDNTLTP